MQAVYDNHHLDHLAFRRFVSTLNLGCLFAKPPPRGLVLQIANILKITYRIICDYLCGQASLLKWRQHPFIIVSSKFKVWYCHNILRILHKIVKHALHVWSGDWRHHGRSSVERITQLHRSGTQFYQYRSCFCFWPPRVVNIKCLSAWIWCPISPSPCSKWDICIWGMLLGHLRESREASEDKRLGIFSLIMIMSHDPGIRPESRLLCDIQVSSFDIN